MKKERFCCQLTQYCQKETVLFCFHGGIIFIIKVSFTQPSRLRLRPLLSACPVRKALPPLCRARPCMDPYRGRFRSDNHAAVLRLQNTQPKDRRAYTPLTGILAERQEKGDGTRQRRRAAGTRTAAPMFFIYTLFSTDI